MNLGNNVLRDHEQLRRWAQRAVKPPLESLSNIDGTVWMELAGRETGGEWGFWG